MDWIYIVVIVVVGFALMRWAGSILFKVLGFLLFIGIIGAALYHYEIGPFKNLKSVNLLEEKYCQNPEPNSFKCECIVEIIDRDLNKRYSSEELKQLENDKWKMGISMVRSFEANKTEIESCLKEHNAEHELDEFISEIMVINKSKGKEVLGKLKKFFKGQIDSLDEMWDDLEDRYKD
jgi:hypothetical protein